MSEYQVPPYFGYHGSPRSLYLPRLAHLRAVGLSADLR
jgi:hypothetical protein